jgi:hypothetical protein
VGGLAVGLVGWGGLNWVVGWKVGVVLDRWVGVCGGLGMGGVVVVCGQTGGLVSDVDFDVRKTRGLQNVKGL